MKNFGLTGRSATTGLALSLWVLWGLTCWSSTPVFAQNKPNPWWKLEEQEEQVTQNKQKEEFKPADGEPIKQEEATQPPPETEAAPPPVQKAMQPVTPLPMAKEEEEEKPVEEPKAPPIVIPVKVSPVVRIAVLNGTGKPERAGMVAVLLKDYHKRKLEKKLGKKVEVVNMSNLIFHPSNPSVIFYRHGYLRAALLVADIVPGNQSVLPMKLLAREKIGVDLEIQLGKDSP